ncbi:MAG: hypothetical protein QOJ04_6587 [Caballeronia sp.]|jgi:hypothetical protein|nr:hypothetical protein [Caballeronia sp.]
MTSDLPGELIDDPAFEPLENPYEEKLPPDSAPEPGITPPGSAAEEEKILDEGQAQTPENPA